MIRLIKIELKKTLPNKTVWVIVGLYLLLLPLVFNFFKNASSNGVPFDVNKIYSFPEIWSFLAYVASYFHVLSGFLIIVLLCNEFSYRTFRQHLIDGLSRMELIAGKVLLIVFIALAFSLYLFLIGLFFGLGHTKEMSLSGLVEKIYLVPLFTLQCIGYMTLALLIAILTRRTGLSMLLFLFYILLLEKMIGYQLPGNIKPYLPVNTFSDLIGFPMKALAMMMGAKIEELSVAVAVGFTVFYSGLFVFISYKVLQKKDL